MAKRGPRVLIAGESWIMHVIHQKGFDSFTTTDYGEGHQFLSAALKNGGMSVTHMPNHLVPSQFPQTAAELDAYDVVI
ncbi:MAG: glutamine amidotransferase, partial [Chloroflexota bacterium]